MARNFFAIVGILATIVALTFPIGIVLLNENKDVIGLVKLLIYISVGIDTFVALTLIFSKD
ncbi:hypothetical protein [Pseudoneobacillus rhizosphaerae]|uniref:hypothetical protein n=1 Tax=Pseudoneobacillus rhizosphaerae TaxID=2880968 RepID=UPI001E425A50|nr:hypothetical protein [Pseudoneobacillus rhizosphaerae]